MRVPMLKQNLLKSAILISAVICMFLLTACDDGPAKENSEQIQSQISVETEEDMSASEPSMSEAEESSAVSPENPGSEIAKINGGADEVGIYSVVVRLTDNAADKGVVELVYYGSKGSPQENSVVNTFRIEYNKEPAGTFEIHTFYDGEVYQNQKDKKEVNVTNTFGAGLRAGSVIISYTPDGGDTREIFRADAEYFYIPAG